MTDSLSEKNRRQKQRSILRAARRLIASSGYEGLTMRELAVASGVSVPTLYHHFGGKDGILAAELADTFGRIAETIAALPEEGFLERAVAVHEAAIGDLLESPGYYRELVAVFLTKKEADEIRHGIDEQYIAWMAKDIEAGKTEGVLVGWIDADTLSRQLYFQLMMSILGWAKGDVDDARLRPIALYGLCLSLLGVAKEPAARKLERRLKELQRQLGKDT